MPIIYVNNNYFSEQNHNMAYIMGFFAADGNISKNGNRIQSQLSIKDKSQLEMIHNEIGGCDVYEYLSNGYKSCGWHCYSAQIKKDLATYGIIPNKTGALRVPQNLKKEYWKDWGKKIFEYSFSGGINKSNIPQEILDDYLKTRKRNFEINKIYLNWHQSCQVFPFLLRHTHALAFLLGFCFPI